MAYAPTWVGFTTKQVLDPAGHNATVNISECPGVPFPLPLSSNQQESSDIEDEFSQEDESFIDISSVFPPASSDSIRFHWMKNCPFRGSVRPPFSPPELHHA